MTSLGGGASSEHGDETVSMVSDTWSTDVLASDTEMLGDADGRPGVVEELMRREADELARNRLLRMFCYTGLLPCNKEYPPGHRFDSRSAVW